MVKNKSRFIAFFAILFLILSATFSFADNEVVENNAVNSASNTSIENAVSDLASKESSYKNKDVYLAGENFDVNYIVDGNLFVCADTVTINSQIGGDAFIIADKVVIGENGYVFGNIFAVCESLEIKGIVYNIYSVSKDINIDKGYVYRDINSSCENITINGVVGRNAFIKCENMSFNTIENSKGHIYGNLEYSAENKIDIPDGSISGSVNYTAPKKGSKKAAITFSILVALNFIIFVLIVWLMCLWLAPKFVKNTEKYTGKKTLPTIGWGLVTLFAIPIISIMLFVFVLTIKVSAFLLGIYILALFIASAISLIVLNNYLCSKLKIKNKYAVCGMLILCSAVTFALTIVPYLNALILLLLTSFGLGVLVDTIIPKKNKN